MVPFVFLRKGDRTRESLRNSLHGSSRTPTPTPIDELRAEADGRSSPSPPGKITATLIQVAVILFLWYYKDNGGDFMKDNVILIGMPGSGKSTVGVLLAKMMGYDFLDSDLLIQSYAGKRLYEILRDEGNDYFADLENRVNAGIHAKKTVIATGGSVVYGAEAMEHLASIGRVVYLKVTPKELRRRIKNFATRGILIEDGMDLDGLYARRAPLYEKYADITVTCGRGSLQKNAEKIIKALAAE